MRVAKDSDIEEIYEIYSHESVSPNMGFDPCSKSEFNTVYAELNETGELLVYENGSRIVAVCKVVRRKYRLRHSVYIGSLAVFYKEQGKGIGSQFFGGLTDKLKKEGYSRMELLVACDNEKAIEFFKKFGFEVEGTHKNYFSRAGSSGLFNEHTMAWVKNT